MVTLILQLPFLLESKKPNIILLNHIDTVSEGVFRRMAIPALFW